MKICWDAVPFVPYAFDPRNRDTVTPEIPPYSSRGLNEYWIRMIHHFLLFRLRFYIKKSYKQRHE